MVDVRNMGMTATEMINCKHQDAVMWNPYNKVVQCHNCGKIFIPAPRIVYFLNKVFNYRWWIE